MSDDIDDFLAGLDSLSTPSFLTAPSVTQLATPILSTDNIRTATAGKKRGRPASSPTATAPPVAVAFAAESAPSTQTSSQSWVCSICTLRNDITNSNCAACNSAPPATHPGMASEHWSCPVCTCVNKPEVATCEACMCERGDSSNVVCKCGCVNRSGARKCKRCQSSISRARPAIESVKLEIKSEASVKAESAGEDPSPMSLSATPTQQGSPVGSPVTATPAEDDQLAADPEVGSESSESDYGTDSDEGEAGDEALTEGQVTNFMQGIPSVNTEHITPAQVPRSMRHSGLKDFQLQAVAWMVDREKLPINNLPMFSMTCKGGLLADYMGLGKTRTIIGLCEASKSIRRDRMVSDRVDSAATLIVCPVSVMSQWRDEIRRTVNPCPRVLIYYGTNRTQSIFQIAQEYDYVISSYHSLAYEYDHSPTKKIFRIQWHRIVLDEAHWIRNRGTHIARASSYLNGLRRWVVTATPIQNRLSDLEPLIAFLKLPGFSEHQWWGNDVDDGMIRCLQAILSTIMLRRTPDTVIDGKKILDLPPKEIITIVDKLPTEEEQFMKDLKNRVSRRLNDAQMANDAFRTYAHAFEMLVRCRQACLHRNIVIESLRAKMGMIGTRTGAEAELDAHKYALVTQQAQEAKEKERAELAQVKAELKLQEAKLKAEMATEEQLSNFVKLMKKKFLAPNSEFALTVIESITSKSAFEIECIICMDDMAVPTLLPCGHIYCKECIKSCIEVSPRCPVCKIKCGLTKLIEVPAAVHGRAAAADGQEAGGTEADGMASSQSDALRLANGQRSKKSKKASQADEQAFLRWLAVDPGPVATWRESDRTRQIRELVQQTEEGDRVLVLSSFVTYLKSLQCSLNGAGISTSIMDGSMNPSTRQSIISRFSQPENGPKVLLASIGTCGVGLNLTRASLCILAEPTWNPGVEEQAVNRIHRLGQTKAVKIVRFSAKDSVEEAMSEICEQKRRLGERLTNSRLSRDDIIAVLQRFARE